MQEYNMNGRSPQESRYLMKHTLGYRIGLLGLVGLIGILGLAGCGYPYDGKSHSSKPTKVIQKEVVTEKIIIKKGTLTSGYTGNKQWTEDTDTPPHERGYDKRLGDNNAKLGQKQYAWNKWNQCIKVAPIKVVPRVKKIIPNYPRNK